MDLLHAFRILEAIEQGQPDYQEEYKEYVIGHKERVKQFADWLVENLPELFNEFGVETFYELIDEHDDSKFSEEEFEGYAQRFYGDKEDSPAFQEAWRHHWMHNEHHPEFWLGEDMPLIYILEMLCDWGSFSIDKGDLTELSKYYYEQARDDEEKNLSDSTKETIEEILSKIDSVLSKEVTD
jgi:hypothetical protein